MLAIKSRIDNNGKLSIPVKLRKKLHINSGDMVELSVIDNKLVVTSFYEKLERARELVNKYAKGSLTEELKKMRKEDAEKE